MIRVMFDSDIIAALPRNAPAATYSDLIATRAELDKLRAEFPFGLELIDRGLGDPTGEATTIDVETGAHKPADAPAWYDAKKAAGKHDLTAYANRSNLAAIESAMGAREYYRWVATLDGTCHVDPWHAPAGPALVQFAGAALLGFHADCNLIYAPTWRPGQQPATVAHVAQAIRSIFG